ncbi:MAG: SDR family NAD(P)-dependent oxidoreductase [Anaerolineae bacterium]|nr:SDR family NAD(P)-dependent oxidoreductase [Anaerolineae bacterium]
MDRTLVVTGATSGIGLATAGLLAARGAHVIGVGRSWARCQQAQATILAQAPGARLTYRVADLASQRQVRALADELGQLLQAQADGALDALIHSAGTVSSWYMATEDGYELQFAVNHLAPFALTHALLPFLRRAPFGRVVSVSSGSHRGACIHWADVMYRRGYGCLRAYKQAKVANVLFCAELNRRLEPGATVRAYVADPGLVNTAIGLKGTSGLEHWVWERRRRGGTTPAQGAATSVFLASDPWVPESRALYWRDCRPTRPSRYALRHDEAARLWALSERLCGLG